MNASGVYFAGLLYILAMFKRAGLKGEARKLQKSIRSLQFGYTKIMKCYFDALHGLRHQSIGFQKRMCLVSFEGTMQKAETSPEEALQLLVNLGGDCIYWELLNYLDFQERGKQGFSETLDLEIRQTMGEHYGVLTREWLKTLS